MGPPDHHFEGQDLLPDERDYLLKALYRQTPNSVRDRVIEKFELAARRAGAPLPKADLPWAELEAEARRMGACVVDVFWDRAGKTKEA